MVRPEASYHRPRPQASHTTPTTAAATGLDDDPQGWGIGKLKKYLAERGVDATACVEKGELVALVREQRADPTALD